MNDSFLQEQGVSGALIESVRRFRESYPVAEGLENRMSTPEIPIFLEKRFWRWQLPRCCRAKICC